jgi:predicted transcriptional regulator
MAATSLKLPDPLKRKIDAAAARARQTPHAFMVDALAREVQRSELRERFAADSAAAEAQALHSGKAHTLAAAFDYLDAKLAGRKVRRPRERPWRTSR